MVLAEQQFATQLAEAHADLTVLPAELKAFGNKSGIAARDRAAAGGHRGAGRRQSRALDELEIATERKQYLDSQAADLTEAMATLENAIRQIDRESRQLLQQTFDTVNENFARLVPRAFRRRTGEARADRRGDPGFGRAGGAQPPGKRNTVDPLCPAARRR
jgi:chromosome segregation protein